MRKVMLKTIAASAGALGLAALIGSASATPALLGAEGLGQFGSLIIVPAMDEETQAVEEDLRPDEMPEAAGDEGAKEAPAPSDGESGGGNVEDEMIDKIGPGAE